MAQKCTSGANAPLGSVESEDCSDQRCCCGVGQGDPAGAEAVELCAGAAAIGCAAGFAEAAAGFLGAAFFFAGAGFFATAGGAAVSSTITGLGCSLFVPSPIPISSI